MVNPPLKAFGRSLSDFEKSFVDYPAEKQLLDACRSGKDAVVFEQRPTEKTKENAVRASFLRFLALGGDEYAPVHENGVILQGAWVEDELNLESVFLPHSLLLVKCHLNTIILRDSNVHGFVSFHGCSVDGLEANGMVCSGSLFLEGDFVTAVCLSGAQIGGDLDCTGGKFNGMDGGDALLCSCTIIKGDVFLNETTATGTVRLVSTQIGGSLECTGAKFSDLRSGDQHVGALVCERAMIKGNISLNGNFTATGTVRLVDAQIDGSLECTSAKFNDPRSGDQHVGALICDRAVIKGGVFLTNGFTASGTVSLIGMQIGGNLDCSKATFNGTDGYALLAEGLVVAGGFFFRDLISANGIVSLASAQISSLVDDDQSWRNVELILDGFIYDRLTGNASTNAKNRLAWLDKQTASHAGLAGDGKDFKPQPWQQLQKVLREMGHIEDARQVAIAFEDQLRAAKLIGQTPEDWCKPRAGIYRFFSRSFHWLFGWLIGYGYRPLGLFFKMVVVWLLCGAVYWWAAVYGNDGNGVFAPSNPLIFQNPKYAACVPDSCAAKEEKIKLVYATLQKLIKPNNPLILQNTEYVGCVSDGEATKAAVCAAPPIQGAGNWYLCSNLPEEYTGFSPLAYSLDLILPLVDLQQENDWAPMISTPTKTSAFWTWSSNHEYSIRFLMWFEILFGWVSSLLLVAVVSGLTKRREE